MNPKSPPQPLILIASGNKPKNIKTYFCANNFLFVSKNCSTDFNIFQFKAEKEKNNGTLGIQKLLRNKSES